MNYVLLTDSLFLSSPCKETLLCFKYRAQILAVETYCSRKAFVLFSFGVQGNFQVNGFNRHQMIL